MYRSDCEPKCICTYFAYAFSIETFSKVHWDDAEDSKGFFSPKHISQQEEISPVHQHCTLASFNSPMLRKLFMKCSKPPYVYIYIYILFW